MIDLKHNIYLIDLYLLLCVEFKFKKELQKSLKIEVTHCHWFGILF